MPEQLRHERVAEPSDLGIRLSLGVEIGATLSSTHVKAGQGILKRLLEPEELEDGEIDGGVQTESALVWAQSRVIL